MVKTDTPSTLSKMHHARPMNILAQWRFPEYEKPQRGFLWYTVALILGGGLFFYAVTTENFLFAIIILLIAFIIFTHHRSEPLQITAIIFESGIQVGDTVFLWRDLKKFCIIIDLPVIKRLYLYPKNRLLRHELSLPLQDQDPLQIRSILLDFVEEDLEKDAESSSDTFTRIFKF